MMLYHGRWEGSSLESLEPRWEAAGARREAGWACSAGPARGAAGVHGRGSPGRPDRPPPTRWANAAAASFI